MYFYKKIILLLFFIAVTGLSYYHSFIQEKLNHYLINTAEAYFGSQPLAEKHEKVIKEIAQRMGVTDCVRVRKMNTNAMRLLGYCNAFAYFPKLFLFIPVGIVPFLFVSEGFFEDLAPGEQRFLIGHEMVHIKERHLHYFSGLLFIVVLLLLWFLWFIKNHVRNFIYQKVPVRHAGAIRYLVMGLLTVVCLLIPELLESVYRKKIERDADYQSLIILNSYEGCLSLMHRWQKEFKMNEKNSYSGFFATHPSLQERTAYCQELYFKNKGLLC